MRYGKPNKAERREEQEDMLGLHILHKGNYSRERFPDITNRRYAEILTQKRNQKSTNERDREVRYAKQRKIMESNQKSKVVHVSAYIRAYPRTRR